MALKIIGIRLSQGGDRPSHIAHFWWTGDSEGSGTRASVVDWVKRGGKAYAVGADGSSAYLEAATTPGGVEYVRTRPDDSKLDNLLAQKKM